MAAVVTIGRNVNDSPMSETSWTNFKEEVYLTIARYGGELYFWGEGEGQSEEWGWEDAYTWVFNDFMFGQDESLFLEGLSDVAAKYEQDAVAYTRGKTVLIAAVGTL